MFKIESYVTPILLSYVDKYVRDFKPADAQVSLWGGGVALHNLVLKADVLQQEVSLPFTLVSGRIHELLIQVPWTKIMSEPIIVTIDTIECVLSLHPPACPDSPPPDSPSRKSPLVEAPPGYMQALVRRIVSNIALRVHHLIVKYVQDDIVLSLNVKHLAVDSAGTNWEAAFADIDQAEPVIRRLVRLDDLTLCLDRADSDGKIRYYQEPLLYRCQLDFRVLTRLVSANTRRASSLTVQLRSTKLAFGVTSEQLVLLLRLLRERPVVEQKQPPPCGAASTNKTSITVTPLHVASLNSAEPSRQESWSEWAWSWLPTWMDREGGVEEAPITATPTPIHFTAYLDDISLVYKVMELESGNRKRARGVLELIASYAAIKSYICSPTIFRARVGTRLLTLCSHGKCTCGYSNLCTINNEPTVYLSKLQPLKTGESTANVEESWKWPEEDFTNHKVETAQVINEEYRESPEVMPSEVNAEMEQSDMDSGVPDQTSQQPSEAVDELWLKMEPVFYFEYVHERSPPDRYANPYDHPPMDFEYSDWVEVSNMKVKIEPMEFRVGMDLLHRTSALVSALDELPSVPVLDLPMRTLTVEENEALSENLPQRCITLEANGFRMRSYPWDHSLYEKPTPSPLVLDVELPQMTIVVNGPMYPYRVCSAACQMPDDTGPLWQGARLHVSVVISAIQVNINRPQDPQPLPCARTDLRFVFHILLHKELFKRESVELSYSFKIREANVSGSAPRLQAAYQILGSLLTKQPSLPLRYTTLARDALNDDDSVAIDVTVEEVSMRGYLTRHINTHILSVQSSRATAIHAADGEDMKQAWIFAAPEAATTTPFLRLAIQWCSSPVPNSLDYLGTWTEPIAFAIDPLFIAWLAYKPLIKQYSDLASTGTILYPKQSQFFTKRRTTTASSSNRSRSGADMIHVHPRSAESSDPSEKKDERTGKNAQEPAQPNLGWTQDGENLLRLHERLQHMLVNVEMGLILLYLTESTASAVDCASIRDAMDRYAIDEGASVMVISFGRLSMHSNSTAQHLWQEIRHDGPTFVTPSETKEEEVGDSFPWRLRVADMSCYTLEVRVPAERAMADKPNSGLRSQLKFTGVTPCTVVELITTTVTLSVVTKSIQFKTVQMPEKKIKTPEPTSKEARVKYFTGGIDFKPATLKEFVRGPAKRKKPTTAPEQKTQQATSTHTISSGPVVSLGIHLHADTPPIIVRLNNEQVHVVATAIHCVQHMIKLLQRPPMSASTRSFTSLGGSHRSLIRSVSEVGELRSSPSDETTSGSHSELISIYESKPIREFPPMKLKTFFWFQWVVSRATLVVATARVKMAFEIDDIISTVDLQEHYNQLKVKLASASVRHYERTGSEEWKAGVLGGRVLEVREPIDAKEENHFLAITITQAQISNLPASWKEELHPKLLEQKTTLDTMWEVYATLAPLEAVLQPMIVEHLISLVHQFSPRSFCPLATEVEERSTSWQWPFCYLSAGGLRLLITSEDEDQNKDDTFMLIIGKITVNPHPDNPICRRPVSGEVGWSTSGAPFEGRQYEVLVKNVAVRSAKFSQLVYHESNEGVMKGALENPAVKWTQPVQTPIITPVLHSVDVGSVLAPALYIGGLLACGPAVELNLMSDCAIELSIHQLSLLRDIIADMHQALLDSSRLMSTRSNTLEMCPYASVIMNQDVSEDLASLVSEARLVGPSPLPTVMKHNEAVGQSFMVDSGVDTLTSKSSRNFDESAHATKKSVSIAFVEQMAEASEYLEVFVTMGVIELALYTVDDGSPEVIALRPPANVANNQPPVAQQQKPTEEVKHTAPEKDTLSRDSRSITETIRNADVSTTKLELDTLPQARSNECNLPLLQVTLNQPNLYYWKKKQNKTLQVSLFNAWVALGMAQTDCFVWNQVLLSTARGIPDPVTDIPPALTTMKLIVPSSSAGSSGNTLPRGTATIDIERPIQIEVCTDRLRRIQGILALIDQRVLLESSKEIDTPLVKLPLLYMFKRFMGKHTMESVTIQTSQIGVCGSEGTVGWASASVQLASGLRPDRVVIRGLVTALLVAAGSPADRRHVLLQPLTFGWDVEATWEAWRRAEGGQSACEPTVRASLCLDRIIMDLRPIDLVTMSRIQHTVDEILGKKSETPLATKSSTDTLHQKNSSGIVNQSPTKYFEHRNSITSIDGEPSGHYYKDDLRSGAFKIVGGGQLPMAYQVMVHGNAVSWRYPHPRAITRIVVFPIPELEEELECVLELFNPMMNEWTPHTYFKLPVSEPREIKLYVPPPDVVFGVMWRFRMSDEKNEQRAPFEFNINKFLPRHDPLLSDISPEVENLRGDYRVSAEQLSGVLRVDSYFAPRLLPHTRFVLRVSAIEVNLHNSLPSLSSQATALEGYYVSRPLMRSHRVLSLNAHDVTANAHIGSPAGTLTILDANFSADVLDCATGAIEELVETFRLRGAVSIPSDPSTMSSRSRVRCRTSRVHVALHVPRLRTLHALAKDWKAAVDDYMNASKLSSDEDLQIRKSQTKRDLAAEAAAALDGRVSLWIHNSCEAALRIGQEGTDEVVPLGPGARLAYRWRSPSATKRLRLAFAGPTADWRWSNSIPFTAGSTKVRLEDSESKSDSKTVPGAGVFVHVHVDEEGARRSMHLSGRLTLANMLRYNLLYKVRGRFLASNQWRTVCSGEMAAESVGRSVICAADTEIILKIKFLSHDTGWSGDIPLKECPKENVPWLVKIPSQGDVPYVSVWCRVVRARSDGRIIAAIWPLYVLHSHLPLDIDVMITSEATPSTTDISGADTPAPLIQTALGRGTSTHLLAPGTTSTRHNLSFQYKNIECPVTREAVPMHYGVTDSSVFDKRSPVNNIDEVVEEILAWLRRSERDASNDWPYSLVTNHWPSTWQAALLQPRCDVVVRYQAVRAGGGCSLEIQLSPVVLLCNAAPIALTLRAHDAAPLCKLEPGSAISPPSAILKKPFFMSVEMGRETFVSGQLEITNSEPGRYSAPPPGKLAIDHSADFVIQCNHKVALLTMYYEIKENINVLGISSTYTLINRLNVDIVVSTIAVPDGETNILLQPKAFKVISPTQPGSVHGVPLCRFWLRSRWRGSCPTELNTYLCVAIPSGGVGAAGAFPAWSPVPVRLGGGNVTARRAIALTDAHGKSMAVVVTQRKQDGRWLIVIAPDPCPQFLVYNRTHLSLAVAQPALYADEPSTSYITVVPEVEGVRWWCTVQPQTLTHYSSPAHSARYPPPANPTPPAIPFLTIGTTREDNEPNWCPSVAAADGEQLLQLYGGITIKLRVRTHPHSTLIELQDVDQNDISASDIRRRLVGALPVGGIPVSQDSVPNLVEVSVHYQTTGKLTRTDAHEKLLPSDVISIESGISHLSEPTLVQLQDETASVVMPMPINTSTDRLNVIMDEKRDGSDGLDTQSMDLKAEKASTNKLADLAASEASFVFQSDVNPSEWVNSGTQLDRVRCVLDSLAVEMATTADARPLLTFHADRVALHVISDLKKMKTTLSVADVQIDNLQYESGQYDFAVVASTHSSPEESDRWPALWNMFAERHAFASMRENARLLVVTQHDRWTVVDSEYTELTEVEIALGPLALYIEDAYVSALAELWRRAVPTAQASDAAASLADEHVLRCPLRLRTLHVHPLDLTLTLHTAVRMYIALDQSPLRLTAFRVQDMMTSVERLTHAVTVHYLSAAILGAGWVVGGLELLGAPGALAARVGGATGGVRGIASAAAAALLRSLSAWAGSLARNLDLLAGDEEHARRAAAARRRPPPSLLAGLVTGITNFAINILGAVGGLAHHPLVGVAVGETESGTTALRRGLLGALTKPLSATADLVAYAGHGLLSQTGWDPIPQPRALPPSQGENGAAVGWKRDCVRWTFRLAELSAVAGFEVLLDNAPLQLLLTHKFLVVADPESERIVEMIDFRYCMIGPYQGSVIELCVTQRRASKVSETRVVDEDDEYQMSAAAMARVARYTGADSAPGTSTVAETRVLHLLSSPGRSYALYAALVAAIHHNADTHFSML